MTVRSVIGRFSRRRRAAPFTPKAVADELLQLTRKFCAADTLSMRSRRASQLFSFIWSASGEKAFVSRLLRWIRLVELDQDLNRRFEHSWSQMIAEMESVSLFVEAGLPRHNALPAEILRRLFQRLLPSAKEESDMGRLFAGIFSSSRSVHRFANQQIYVFERLVKLLWPRHDVALTAKIGEDIRQALCLLAARVAGRGVTEAVRQRSTTQRVEGSPFYRLFFETEAFARTEQIGPRSEQFERWKRAVMSCRQELEQIHIHMEDAGVSSALVYDLRSIEATLERMQLLAAVLAVEESAEDSAGFRSAGHELLLTLVRGRLEDTRLLSLFRQNLNLLARKTVERTGHGGEHYIAHTRAEYWGMWRAAIGGGLLTVFTAAIKMRVIESHFPLFVEGFLISTDYAISFILLQVFGFALATKQPSMTAATLAGIIRENRGVSRWSKVSEFAADISRTQLAAAFGNVIAVCVGAVAFEKVWVHIFKTHYLPIESAQHVYQTLHPFTSGTAIFAALTGVLLWLAALIGGWFENFAVYHRLPEAILQHPLRHRIGVRNTQRSADWLERNIASWSTSIVLGFLLGFSPVVARFFGISLDVRHVTLSTGTLALAAARFGTSSFGHDWLYYAIAGIGITFILNLGVSFSIASIVALRAYDVPRSEQIQILKFVIKDFFESPLEFIFPARPDILSIAARDDERSEKMEAIRGEAEPEVIDLGRRP